MGALSHLCVKEAPETTDVMPCSARLCQAVQVRREPTGEKGGERDPVGPRLLTASLRS